MGLIDVKFGAAAERAWEETVAGGGKVYSASWWQIAIGLAVGLVAFLLYKRHEAAEKQ
jgi:hypothetical protein